MFAIVETGGKQYRVQEGSVIEVELLDAEAGKSVVLDKVLLVQKGKNIKDVVVGTPVVEGAKVEAKVLESFKDEKVIIFKKRRRKNSRRKRGHRQDKMKIEVTKIVVA